jgi:molecular chaperone GrpE
MSNTDENLNDIEEKVEEKKDENLDTLKVESNTKKDSNTKNIEDEVVEKSDLQLEDLIKERDELKDKLMRSLAESENTRKRAFKDRQDAETYAVSRMSRDILSVFDNLQRALDLADDILDEKSLPMIEGLELTKKDLLEVFKRNKIEKIEPLSGDKFDPQLHQAMMEAPSKEIEKGCIIHVLSVGFLIGERLLRASNVTVSSGAENIEEKVTQNLD